jgi:Lipocalin-like domain
MLRLSQVRRLSSTAVNIGSVNSLQMITMKTSKNIFLIVFASLALIISAAYKTTTFSDKITSMKKNKVAGTWHLVSAYMDNHGKRIDILGSHPGGMLIFTDDLQFMVVINNPDLPKFVSGDRLNGTPEEYKTAVVNSLGVYGTYTIDENGDFLEEHVLGSTFQNMNGTVRDRNEISEKVDGNRMIENLKIGDGINMNIVWQRAN